MLGALAAGHAMADDFAVSGKIGTLGLGVEVTKAFSESITGRIGLNGANYDSNMTESNIDYDFNFKFQSVKAMVDWYPSQGEFRGSLGLAYNNNQLDYSANPTGNTYEINGVTYNTADIGSLNGNISFNKLAPYIGIGWGNPVAKGKDWGFVLDVGLLYAGAPEVTMNVTCGAALSAATCTNLTNDVAAERLELESEISSLKWYPVISVGISKKF